MKQIQIRSPTGRMGRRAQTAGSGCTSSRQGGEALGIRDVRDRGVQKAQGYLLGPYDLEGIGPLRKKTFFTVFVCLTGQHLSVMGPPSSWM